MTDHLTLIESDTPRCDQGRDQTGTWPTMRCQRPLDHSGQHMSVHEVLSWDDHD